MSIRLAHYNRTRGDDGRKVITRAFHVDTEAEIEQCVDENYIVGGMQSTSDTASNWDPDTIEGGYRVEITYEGRDNTQYAPNVPERGRWSFRPSFEKEPMEKHPKIDVLVDYYDGEIDPESKRVTFPETFFRSANTTGPGKSNHWQGGNTGGSGNLEKNPLYGMDESGYLALTGVATCRYTTNSLSSATSRVGEIFERLPYSAPNDFNMEGRNWLKAPPVIEELGQTDGDASFSVEEVYMLSEKGGWPPTVYDFIDL
jgi:hypothetical protein